MKFRHIRLPTLATVRFFFNLRASAEPQKRTVQGFQPLRIHQPRACGALGRVASDMAVARSGSTDLLGEFAPAKHRGRPGPAQLAALP